MIAVAIASVAATMTGEIAFGMMCEPRIERPRTPTAFAASTKSFSFCARIELRNRRAKIGMFTTPTATMILPRPCPSMATSPIASRKPGMASITSMQRMIPESTIPPAYPAIDPSRSPTVRPISTATKPISSEYRVP
jgi:hypothetical protein